jgi:hypothetical protein
MKKQIERGDFMNCSDFQELISAKLDKELTKEEEKLLSEHLKTCINCAGFAKELRELKIITSNWRNEQIPPGLEKRILTQTVDISRKEKPVLSFLKGYYKIPKSLVWASTLLFLMILFNSIFNPIRDISEAPKIERAVPEKSKFQRVVLTEKDIVVTYVILGNKN